MEFEQAKRIVEVVAKHLGKEVTLITAEERGVKLNNGFFVEYSKDGIANTIIYSKSPNEPLYSDIALKCFRKRVGTFLKNVGYDDTDELLMVMGIIHEFGHMEYYSIVNKYDFDKQYKFLREMVGNYVRSAWAGENHRRAKHETGDDLIYMSRGDEMYCDGFAKDHFIPVMKMIEEQGLL